MKPHDLIESSFRLSPSQKSALKKLGLKTVLDLLYHFPTRYGDTSEMKSISSLKQGETTVIFGKISGLKTGKGFRTKIPMADGTIEDDTGKIKAVWFNQPYLAKMLAENSFVRAEGKVSARKKNGELYLSNPKIERVEKLPTGVGDSLFGEAGETHSLYPVYPESRGITSNWFYHAIQKVLKSGILEILPEPIPAEILEKYHLPTLKTALVWIHAPLNQDNAMSARKRFAFEEVFFIQLSRQLEKRKWQEHSAFIINKSDEEIAKFTSRFPFEATLAQKKAIAQVLSDFKIGKAMSRLLEGDVGSGKTAVAATTAYATITTPPKDRKFGTLQVAYMCPTEILATQHFESFIQYFRHLPIQIGLITSSGCRKFPSKLNPSGWTDISRTQLLKWAQNGEIAVLIGTHSLISKSVKFKNLAYAIIDEQHRFGTAQRSKLVRKDNLAPHLLSMTATPIPRTLALTIYGDLDLSLLDQMPHGRKPIITEIVLPNKREETYEKIRAELKAGQQAYIICPRIDEPDPAKEMAILAKSVKEEAKRLRAKIFPEYEIEILHSKMSSDDKDEVMLAFKRHEIDILVATSVVEVGVNVENATTIIIEGAERFGLAQLHQLRGRVIRSNHQAYCHVFAETKTQKTIDRLKAFQTAKNGFELAEYDLQFRGAGELSGLKQWGITDIGMEALKNLKMVEAARNEALHLISTDPTFSKFPQIKTALAVREQSEIHFE
ncbi:MAG: ATP-dependent DNA helicase RecG [Candidatus Paceibacterota bacterium]